jgi:hypothetical protein
MAILFYQIGIFFIIQIAALFGRKVRNIAVVLIIIFTLLQVFASSLMIIQFFTIIIGYVISNRQFQEPDKIIEKPKKVIVKSYSQSGGRIYKQYDENDNLSPQVRKQVENQNEISRLAQKQYDNDPELKKAVDDVIADMFKRNRK